MALALLAIASIAWPGYVIDTSRSIMDTAFYLKLTLTIPLLLAFWFCEAQYGRERRLEEEYAFKANISISLVPFQELISKLVRKEDPKEIDKYSAFVIDSVNKVFSSPTEKIFEKDEKKAEINNQEGLSVDILKKVVSTIEPLLKAIVK
ncbi:MAG: hypothetical protein M1491_10120 [Deltaproteobacteria bacterium]|nr:hypothetical protein [Deltaproteobacteria bacterium]MCL5277615.1 hypothetical protein [Deltaproteobacteria bacterium]